MCHYTNASLNVPNLVKYFEHFERSFRQEVRKNVLLRREDVVVNNEARFVSYNEYTHQLVTK